MGLNIIVPCWSHGEITPQQHGPVIKAVASGVGIAGCHGGGCAIPSMTAWIGSL